MDENEYDCEQEEILEDDITTEDYITWYQGGKECLWTGKGNRASGYEIADNWAELLREYMQGEEYWPNVWYISDHGNVSLIHYLEE